jgi:hypothetical protein
MPHSSSPSPRQIIDTTRSQHETLAMTTLARIKRYVDADLKAGHPSVEHAEMIHAASWVYGREAEKAAKDDECAARHEACAGAPVLHPRFAAPPAGNAAAGG